MQKKVLKNESYKNLKVRKILARLKDSNVRSCSKTWCEKRTRPFPDRARPIFALLVLFSRRSYYLRAWHRLEKNKLRVWGKAQSVFFPAIARHFFPLVLKLWRNSSGYGHSKQQQKLIWGFFHIIQFLSWHFTTEPFRLLLTFHLSQHSYPNPNPKETLTTSCEFSAILTFSPSLPFRPGSPGGPCN